MDAKNTSETLEKIHIEAYSNFDYEKLLFSVKPLFEYRKEVALRLTKPNSEETHKNLMDVYNRTNENIKKILGLY